MRAVHHDAYVEAWSALDPDGHGHLSISMLPRLIRQLPPPLGLKRTKGLLAHSDVSRFILTLDIRAFESAGGAKIVLFHELLIALTTRALHTQADHLLTPGGDPPADVPSLQPLPPNGSAHRESPASRQPPQLVPSSSSADLEQLRRQFLGAAMKTSKDLVGLRRRSRDSAGVGTHRTVGDVMEAADAVPQVADEAAPASVEGAVDDSLVYSLQAEYAVTVIQERWRHRKEAREARALAAASHAEKAEDVHVLRV